MIKIDFKYYNKVLVLNSRRHVVTMFHREI